MCDSRIITRATQQGAALGQDVFHTVFVVILYSETLPFTIHVNILSLRIPFIIGMNESHFHYDEGRDIS